MNHYINHDLPTLNYIKTSIYSGVSHMFRWFSANPLKKNKKHIFTVIHHHSPLSGIPVNDEWWWRMVMKKPHFSSSPSAYPSFFRLPAAADGGWRHSQGQAKPGSIVLRCSVLGWFRWRTKKVKTMVETWWLHVIRHGLTMKEHITIKIDDDYYQKWWFHYHFRWGFNMI